jgi:hypothetical protein
LARNQGRDTPFILKRPREIRRLIGEHLCLVLDIRIAVVAHDRGSSQL